MLVVVVNAGFTGALARALTGYATLLVVIDGGERHHPVPDRDRQGLAKREDHHIVLSHHRHHPCWAVSAIGHRRIG